MTDYPRLNPPVRLLCGPGPSNIHPQVLEAMQQPMLGHLDPEFHRILEQLCALLAEVYRRDDGLTIALSASGTSGMEAGIASLLEPGETAIVAAAGFFGNRIVDIAQRHGANVIDLRAPYGQAVGNDRILDELAKHPETRLVAVVHAETSTGVGHPLQELAEGMRGSEALLMADCVTSLGSMELEPQRWGVDYCYSCSQKCLGAPPGISPVTLSPRAMERIGQRTTPPPFSFDFELLAKYWIDRPVVYHHTTPNVQYYALYEGIRLALEEGLDARWARHSEAGGHFQQGMRDRGFEMLAEPGLQLAALSAVRVPEGIDGKEVQSRLLEEHGIEVGGGLGPDAPPIWRVGLMGVNAHVETADRLLEAFDAVLAPDRTGVALGEQLLMAVLDRPHRSELAVPGSNLRAVAKAPTLGADVVFLDLEDAVAPDDKVQARENVIAALNDQDWSACSVSVRVNGLDTHWCYRDIVDVVERAGGHLDTILIPKVGTPADVLFVATLLEQIEAAHGLERINLHILIETALGMANVEAIAQTCPERLEAMVFGVADYAASTQARTTNIGGANEDYSVLTDPVADGVRQRHWGDQWHFALSRMVVACRAYGLRPIDGPFGDYSDADGYTAAARRAAQLGCEGKWAIHPSQIALANEVFSPSEAEVERARRILEAMEQAAAEGKGAVSLDGKLIDAASIKMAENLVARVERMESRVAEDPRLAEGLALLREGRGFEAHELFEDMWREAPQAERDFCQGLVHVAVSLHLERRGSLTGMRSQLGKARRRLTLYAPAHRGVDVAAVVAWCDRSLELGGCDGSPPV